MRTTMGLKGPDERIPIGPKDLLPRSGSPVKRGGEEVQESVRVRTSLLGSFHAWAEGWRLRRGFEFGNLHRPEFRN